MPRFDPQPRSRPRRLRVGYITVTDPHDPDARSGVTYSTFNALRAAGLEVVPLLADRSRPRRRRPAPWLAPAGRALRKARRVLTPRSYRGTIERARERSRRVRDELRSSAFDALVCVNASSALYHLYARLPLVYSTDVTAKLLVETYSEWARRPDGFKRAWHEIECSALEQATAVAVPSERTIASLIEDYSVPTDRIHLVPRGANLVPRDEADSEPRLPSRRSLNLCVVAQNPRRKRLDFCIEVVERLAQDGIDARLHYIGPPVRRALRSPRVECHGRLRLSVREDREIHRHVLRESHLILLPSLAEAYGIAAVEAASFGCPGVVSDVGGLPTIVRHDATGLVLPSAATPLDYARSISELVDDPDRYLVLARGALDRARSVLNWKSWGQSVAQLARNGASRVRRCESRTVSVSSGAARLSESPGFPRSRGGP